VEHSEYRGMVSGFRFRGEGLGFRIQGVPGNHTRGEVLGFRV